MAVMVLAIPVGASAFTDDYVYTGPINTTDLPFVKQRISLSNLPPLPTSTDNYFITHNPESLYTGLVRINDSGSVIDFTNTKSGASYILSKDLSTNKIYWKSYGSYTGNASQLRYESTKEVMYSTFKAVAGDEVFFMSVLPPPPPKPVKLEAVKTVEEIVPQAGAVAGGIVLVASILLGLWLVIGLVRRLVSSYLR